MSKFAKHCSVRLLEVCPKTHSLYARRCRGWYVHAQLCLLGWLEDTGVRLIILAMDTKKYLAHASFIHGWGSSVFVWANIYINVSV